MNTHLTITDMMRELKISPEKYNNFKQWCYRHHEELDTRDCVWNHGYYAYNVDLVRLKCPFVAVVNADKVSTPETIETPLSAAERLAAAINTATGQNVTGGDILAAFERGKDYIRMRRTMARTLWRVRKERRHAKIFSRNAMRHSNNCISAKIDAEQCETHCRNYSESCKVNADFTSEYLNRAFDVSRNAEKAARMMNVIMFTIFVICAATIGTVYEIIN